MRTQLLAAATLLLAACSTSAEPTHVQLMDEVEKQVRLPEGAGRLDEYARYYAFGEKSAVVAVYLLSSGEDAPDVRCEELAEDMTTSVVQCRPPTGSAGMLRAGQRRWVDDPSKLPVVFDGGCAVVNVSFNLSSRTVEHEFCNGVG